MTSRVTDSGVPSKRLAHASALTLKAVEFTEAGVVGRAVRRGRCCTLALASWVFAVILLPAVLPTAQAAESAPAASAVASAAPTHRPLRENQPPAALEPTEPQTFRGYPGAQAFKVVSRKEQLALYPCSQCHKALPLNPQPRKLVNAPHPAALDHGKGRMWCLDCHQGNDRDVLHTVGGAKVDFNDSHLVCGQCHSARQRDWYFGAHGKRVAGWSGDRELYSCTHCHDPHNPTLQARVPSKPPPLRAGLAPMNRVPEHAPLPWQRQQKAAHDAQPAKP